MHRSNAFGTEHLSIAPCTRASCHSPISEQFGNNSWWAFAARLQGAQGGRRKCKREWTHLRAHADKHAPPFMRAVVHMVGACSFRVTSSRWNKSTGREV
eukprot:420144-Alexandrium_andersonii.AAC.1